MSATRTAAIIASLIREYNGQNIVMTWKTVGALDVFFDANASTTTLRGMRAAFHSCPASPLLLQAPPSPGRLRKAYEAQGEDLKAAQGSGQIYGI